MQPFANLLDRVVNGAIGLAKWLILPVVVLLFLQWPLRDFAGAYSREANDLGQWLFALLAAASVTAATAGGTHLASDAFSRRYSQATRAFIARLGILLGLLPWSIFVLWSSRDLVLTSVRALERFPDTFNPGYFVVKASVWVLAGLMLLRGLRDLISPADGVGERLNPDEPG